MASASLEGQGRSLQMSGFRLDVKLWVVEKVPDRGLRDLWGLNTELGSSVSLRVTIPGRRSQGPEEQRLENPKVWGE